MQYSEFRQAGHSAQERGESRGVQIAENLGPEGLRDEVQISKPQVQRKVQVSSAKRRVSDVPCSWNLEFSAAIELRAFSFELCGGAAARRQIATCPSTQRKGD